MAKVSLQQLKALTTKGDILTYAAAHARLAVGTNGQILVVDSGATNGIKWATAASGGTSLDPISSEYPIFTPGADDDEFNDANFTGWTLVDAGTQTPTVTEINDVASILHPGGDTGNAHHAYMKARTITTGSYVEIAFRMFGVAQNYNLVGLVFADGTTYGAGNQVSFFFSPNETTITIANYTNYSTYAGSFITKSTLLNPTFSDMFLRLFCVGANSWAGYISCDGISWINATGSFAATLSPTKAGFMVRTAGGSLPFIATLRYAKFN